MIRHAPAGRGVPGRPVAGRGDRAVPPGFAGAAGWRPAVGAAALSAGSARRSIGAPGHNDDRSRTPRHSRPPGRTVDAVALRGPPIAAFPADRTTATPHGKRGLIYRRMFGGFLRPGTRSSIGRLTVGVFPFRLRPRPARAPASRGAHRRAVASTAPSPERCAGSGAALHWNRRLWPGAAR